MSLNIFSYELTSEFPNPDLSLVLTKCFEVPDEAIAQLRGNLYIILDLKVNVPRDLGVCGKLVIDEIISDYYSDLDSTPLRSLEKAIYASKSRVSSILFSADGSDSDIEIDLNILACSIVGNFCFIAKLGEMLSLLVRNNTKEEIAMEDAPVVSASGSLQKGDSLFLASSILSNKRSLFSVYELSKKVRLLSASGMDEDLEVPEILEDAGVIVIDAKELVSTMPVAFPTDIYTSTVLPAVNDEDVQEIITTNAQSVEKKSILSSIVQHMPFKASSRRKPLYVKRESQRNAKSKLIPFMLFVLFFSSIGIFVNYIVSKLDTTHLSSTVTSLIEEDKSLTNILEQVEKADAAVDLDNDKAKEFYLEALKLIENARKSSNLASHELDPLNEKVVLGLDKVNKVSKLSNIKLLYDTAIQTKLSSPSSITLRGNSLFVADPGANAIYRLRLDQDLPTLEKVNSDEASGVSVIRAGNERLFLLKNGKPMYMDLKDGIFKDIASGLASADYIEPYLSNVYIYSKSASMIYKVPISDDGFGESVAWLSSGTSLTNAKSFSIDGSLFVVSPESGVSQYIRGLKTEFSVSGLDMPLKTPTFSYTDIDSKILYLLDSGNSRIVLIGKESGNYLQQYKSTKDGEMNDLRDIFVDEETTSLYYLNGTKVLRIDL